MPAIRPDQEGVLLQPLVSDAEMFETFPDVDIDLITVEHGALVARLGFDLTPAIYFLLPDRRGIAFLRRTDYIPAAQAPMNSAKRRLHKL
jgi:hypothetical protein